MPKTEATNRADTTMQSEDIDGAKRGWQWNWCKVRLAVEPTYSDVGVVADVVGGWW